MKFEVLAPDYDGTIARDGVLDSDVKAAIMEARAHWIAPGWPIVQDCLSSLRSLRFFLGRYHKK
jgi:hypothetical protein